MEDLGAANAIEDFHAETILEALVQGLWKRLAGGYRVPDAGEIEVGGLSRMGQQLSVVGRHREEQRWSEPLDLRIDVRRRRWPGPEDGGRTNRKGKRQGVAQTVGKEKLGHRERPIRGRDPQDSLRVADHGVHDVVMQMHGALGKAGCAGGVEPERGVVLAGLFDFEQRGVREQTIEPDHVGGVCGPIDDEVVEIRQLVPRNDAQLRQQCLADDRGGGPGIVEHVPVILALQQGVGRNRYRTDLLGAKKAVDKSGGIEQEQQYAFLATDAQGTETVGQAAGAIRDLRVGDRLIATEDRRLASASFANVPIDQVVSDVKRVRDGNDRSRPGGALDRRGHAPSLELAFASPAADIGHVIAVAAHRLAAFLSRLARLRA